MSLSSTVVGTMRPQAASAASGWAGFLRYYFAGNVTLGLFPHQLLGQAELLSVSVLTPQQISLR